MSGSVDTASLVERVKKLLALAGSPNVHEAAAAAARMPLLYLPYIPNRYEHLILQNRRILQNQMDYLMAKVPKHSRLHS